MNRASGAVLPRATRDSVSWFAGPISFQLSSPHPEVLRRAREVFAPWLTDSPTTSPRATFVVESVSGGRRWRVLGGDAPTYADSLDLALTSVEFGAVASIHKLDSEVVALHAALVSRGGRGSLLVGPKESGKSTLACALWRSGWRLHSDDSALLEDGACAGGIPRRVSLRSSSRDLLGSRLWERIKRRPGTFVTPAGLLFHPWHRERAPGPRSIPVVSVVFLARRNAAAGPAETHALDAGRALLALAPYSNRREAGIAPALDALQPLVDRVPVHDLGRGPLAAMVARVEELTA